MSIFVLGADGYLGWPLAMRIARRFPEEKIVLVDNQTRRSLVDGLNGKTITPILKLEDRVQALRSAYKLPNNLVTINLNLTSPEVDALFAEYKPRIVYNLAQIGSAAYSMRGVEEACYVLNNNEAGNMRVLWAVRKNCPEAHIIKSGSFGQYAKCGLDIPEGYFYPEHNGQKATSPAPFPRQSDDIYHVSKINDSNYVSMACRMFGLRVTDVMQSTVFGIHTEETRVSDDLLTRFDHDEFFGTVLNRFVAQAVSRNPITVYGTGFQRTGLMALEDAIASLSSMAEDAPAPGTHRVVNNVTEKNYCIREIADAVGRIAADRGIATEVSYKFNPRQENDAEKKKYDIVTHYVSSRISPTEIGKVIAESMDTVTKYKSRISAEILFPALKW